MGATLQPDFNAQGYYVDPSATLAAQASGEGEFYASFGIFIFRPLHRNLPKTVII
jgi:hypothetical protein